MSESKEIAKREVVHDVVPILDTGRFEQMQRIASIMASSSLVPDHLIKGNRETAVANCFLVVNQAVMWAMDPFAVAQMVSVVHGRLCYEGKLIHAIIEQKLGIRLAYEFFGKEETEGRGVTVAGKFDDEEAARPIKGTVADWKVTQKRKDGSGDTSAWTPKTYDRMLRYRGAREWCRAYAPGIILGVYDREEMTEIEEREPIDITPPPAPDVKVTTLEDVVAAAPAAPYPEMPKELDRRAPKAPAKEPLVIEHEPPDAPPVQTEAPQQAADYVLDTLKTALELCDSHEEVTEVMGGFKDKVEKLIPPDQEEAREMCKKALRRVVNDVKEAPATAGAEG